MSFASSRFRPSPNNIGGNVVIDGDIVISGSIIVLGSSSFSGSAETASNIGTGTGVFAQKVGVDLQFKSLVGIGSVSISSSATEIFISSSASGGAGVGDITNAANVGTGQGIFQTKSGTFLNFRTLLATGSITLISGSDTITISGSAAPSLHATQHQDAGIDEIIVSNLLGELADPQKVTIRVNDGINVGSRPRLNFITGSNIFISASQDIVNDEIDILFSSSGGGGTVTSAQNIGAGEGIFSTLSGSTFQFRSIVGSGSVSIISGSNTITIFSNPGGGTLFEEYVQDQVATNFQTVFTLDQSPVDPSDVILYVNGFAYDVGEHFTVSGTTVTWLDVPFTLSNTDDVKITYSISSSLSPGETNLVANVGSGEGVFRNKTGVTFNFRSILGAGNISIISGTNEITISSSAVSGSGETNTASNIGSGEGVFANKVGVDLRFRSLTASGSVSIISGSNTINISSSHGNLGGGSLHALATTSSAGFMSSGDKLSSDLFKFTGIVSGGILSINTGNSASFDISSGTGYVVDNHTNPLSASITTVTWPTQTAISASYLSTNITTNIALNLTGGVVQQTTDFDTEQMRDLLLVGRIVHTNHLWIDAIRNHAHLVYNSVLNAYDFIHNFGPMNITGNEYNANGANLKLNKSGGRTFDLGANYKNSAKDPNIILSASGSALPFSYRYRDGSGSWVNPTDVTDIEPGLYDDGTGILATVPGGRFTIQLIFFFASDNDTYVQPGQATYPTMGDADVGRDNPVEIEPNFARATFRGWLILRSDTTDLTNPARAKFIAAGKFGSAIGGVSTSGESNTASNVGTGQGVFANKIGVDLQFRTLLATGSISLISGSNEITISGSAIGETNTASNTGSGEGVFANKVGVDLRFRTLLATGSISLISGSNAITISASVGGDVFGPSSATDRAVTIYDGTSGKLIQNSLVTIDISGALDNNQEKYNGIRFYNKSGVDPSSPTPSDGDRYYNTDMHLEMVYDGYRSKWLSNESVMMSYGRAGTTAQGVFFKGSDVIFTSTNGYTMPFSGTIVAVGYARDDSDAAVFEFLSNGTQITFISSSVTSGADYTINSNFSASQTISVRNQSGGNTATDVQGWFRVRWRR